MRLLTKADNLVLAHHWANVLRAAGIACEVRNTALSGALGEIPFLEAAPQLWVGALDVDHARQLLDEASRPIQGERWHCSRCGEECEPQFASCWSCGQARD